MNEFNENVGLVSLTSFSLNELVGRHKITAIVQILFLLSLRCPTIACTIESPATKLFIWGGGRIQRVVCGPKTSNCTPMRLAPKNHREALQKPALAPELQHTWLSADDIRPWGSIKKQSSWCPPNRRLHPVWDSPGGAHSNGLGARQANACKTRANSAPWIRLWLCISAKQRASIFLAATV